MDGSLHKYRNRTARGTFDEGAEWKVYRARQRGKLTGHAPPRNHSVMVVRTSFGDYVIKPWRPT